MPHFRAALIALAFSLSLWSGEAVGHESRQTLLASGQITDAELVSLEVEKLTLASGEKRRALALSELVRWGNLSKREPRPTIVLRDGSLLPGAPSWTRSGSVELSEDVWRVRNVGFRKATVKRASVRAVWLAAAGEDPRFQAIRQQSAAYRGDSDRVWMIEGDVLSGKIVSLKNRELTLNTLGEEVKIDSKRIAAAAMSNREEQVATPSDPSVAVGLTDGTLLYGREVALAKERLQLTLMTGEQLSGAALSSVSFLQPFGKRVLYLSDLQPLDFRHTPYLGVRWPLARDQGLTGRPLESVGRRVLKGLAMHSASRAVYRIGEGFQRFEAEVAIDQSAGRASPGGSVTFSVYVARDAGFESAWESGIVRAGDPPKRVSVKLDGAKAIALLVDYADYGDQQDHADWLDARLVK